MSDDVLFRQESAVEYFKDLGGRRPRAPARGRRRTDLLLRRQSTDELPAAAPPMTMWKPLAVKLARALDAGGAAAAKQPQADRRRVAVHRPGSFPIPSAASSSTSTTTSAIGGHAYSALSRYETDAFSPAFAELAQKFGEFVDVLCEVSERTLLRVEHRPAAPLREMAEDREPPRAASCWWSEGSCRTASIRTDRIH